MSEVTKLHWTLPNSKSYILAITLNDQQENNNSLPFKYAMIKIYICFHYKFEITRVDQ